MEPSIKGTVVATVVDELHQYLASGKISRDSLEARLEKPDFKLIDEKILPGSWYPIASHDRILRLLRDEVGHGARSYCIEGGRRAAEALAESGLYIQFELAKATERKNHIGLTLVTLAGTIYSFSRWNWKGWNESGNGFRIEVVEAEAMPDTVVARMEGFVERAVALSLTGRWSVHSERAQQDRIILVGEQL